MKLQLPATSAIPAAVAAAAIAFALLLFPGGGTSVRSADVAPALRLVAGDVAAVVQTPARSVTKAQPKAVAATQTAGVAGTSAPTQHSSSPVRTRSAPVHRAVSRGPAPLTHVVKPTPVQAPVLAAPQVITQSVKHGNGKAKTLGHLKKTKAVGHRRKVAPHASSQTTRGGGAKGAAVRGVAVSHGPPAVPPGRAKGKAAGGQDASGGRGGGK